jgi:hypothetical protein
VAQKGLTLGFSATPPQEIARAARDLAAALTAAPR